MTGPESEIVEVARRVAEETLRPASDALDRSGGPPEAQLDALAEAGLYGLAGPVAWGGLDADLATACRVVETLAGACLTTTFVWIQHHGVVRAVTQAAGPVRDALLTDLCRGRRRGGVVLAGLKPGPVVLGAASTAGRWSLAGTVPWFTGWGLVDVALVAARTPGDEILTAVLDVTPDDRTLAFARGELLALQGSVTGSLAFAETPVPADRLLAIEPPGDWSAGAGLRLNGALGLGVASRCLEELGDRAQDGAARELARLRADLVEVPDEAVARVRAEIVAFSLRCAGARLAAQGSRGIDGHGTAARRHREAGFLLTFGQRPAIQGHLLSLLTG